MNRSTETSPMHSAWLGRVLYGISWSPDWKWDWTSVNGDEHMDFASIALCRRGSNPPIFRVTLGPVSLLLIRTPKPKRKLEVGDRIKARFTSRPGRVVSRQPAGVFVRFDGEEKDSVMLHPQLHLLCPDGTECV